MRDDFAKLLVERPRRHAGKLRKGRAPRSDDALPKTQGLRRAVLERGWGKDFDDHLSPLKRYLDKQVGRPWNKVHGEIRAHIKPGHTVQEHLMAHVLERIAFDVIATTPSDSAPCGLAANPGRSRGGGYGLRPGDLYVDPATGLLRKARRKLKGPPD